jgi:hypothetical protein
MILSAHAGVQLQHFLTRILALSFVFPFVIGCGPSAGGGGSGGSSTGDTQIIGDPDAFVGQGDGTLKLFLNNAGEFNGDTFKLDALVPGTGAVQRVNVQVANFGEGLLTISKVALEESNADGTPQNLWIALESGKIDLESGLPAAIKPHAVDISSVLSFELVYAPTAFDGNSATLVIESNDSARSTLKIRFEPPQLQPAIKVTPEDAFFWYATPLTAEELKFEIHNTGIAPLLVQKVVIEPAGELFTLVEEQVMGPVSAKGSAGYEPITLHVRYAPNFKTDGGTAVLRIESTDPGGAVEIPLTGKYHAGADKSPCLWEWDGALAKVVDFSDVESGSQSRTLTMHNLGSEACTVNSISFENDPNGQFYSWSAEVSATNPEDGSFAVTELPAAIAPGKALSLHISYSASDMRLNTPLTIEYTDPSVRVLAVTAKGGGPTPCIHVAPGPTNEPGTLQFVQPLNSASGRSFVVYSCGPAGALTVESVQIFNSAAPDLPSADWSVSSPSAGMTKILAGQIQVYKLTMTPYAEETILQGTMRLTHLTADGPADIDFKLEGLVGDNYETPIAHPGETADYLGAVAGEPLILSGAKSVAGSNAIALKGYTWSLVARPPSSTLVVNGGPGPVEQTVTPDVSGVYTFNLSVKSGGTPVLHSAEQSVLIVVDEVGLP